jgi:hypothetical protein
MWLRRMPSLRNDFFVVTTSIGGDERFAIVWRSRLPTDAFLQSGSPEHWRDAFQAYLRTLTLCTEDQIRARLIEMQLPSDDVEDQIDRARRMHAAATEAGQGGEFVWETTTRVGYRNRHGQEVIRNTGMTGTLPLQKIYVLRCGDCACEYGANGSEVHSRQCPACQGGPTGLSTAEA